MDWAGLPLDMLIELAVRLTIVDWFRFRAVCTAGKRAAETALGSRRRPKREPPWLMAAGSDAADLTTASLFSFHDGRCRSTGRLPEPEIQRRIWIGSAYGWFVTAVEACALHLLDPVTGTQIPLLPIGTMGYFQRLPSRTGSDGAIQFLFRHRSFLTLHSPDRTYMHVPESEEIPADQMPLRFLRKAIPLQGPGSGEYLVMMIHGPLSKLVFARQRDAKWVILPSSYLFEDIICYKGQFYAATKCGTVLIWEPHGETFKPRIAVPEHSEDEDYFNKYLAESLDGDLVLVWRAHRSCVVGDSDSSSSSDDDDDIFEDNMDLEYVARPDPTVRFQVFVLREGCQGRSEWKELHNLGGGALFSSATTRLCSSRSMISLICKPTVSTSQMMCLAGLGIFNRDHATWEFST